MGYSDDDLGTTSGTVKSRAALAAAAALALTTDAGQWGTKWFVYDRKTEKMFEFEQGEFANLEVK